MNKIAILIVLCAIGVCFIACEAEPLPPALNCTPLAHPMLTIDPSPFQPTIGVTPSTSNPKNEDTNITHHGLVTNDESLVVSLGDDYNDLRLIAENKGWMISNDPHLSIRAQGAPAPDGEVFGYENNGKVTELFTQSRNFMTTEGVMVGDSIDWMYVVYGQPDLIFDENDNYIISSSGATESLVALNAYYYFTPECNMLFLERCDNEGVIYEWRLFNPSRIKNVNNHSSDPILVSDGLVCSLGDSHSEIVTKLQQNDLNYHYDRMGVETDIASFLFNEIGEVYYIKIYGPSGIVSGIGIGDTYQELKARMPDDVVEYEKDEYLVISIAKTGCLIRVVSNFMDGDFKVLTIAVAPVEYWETAGED